MSQTIVSPDLYWTELETQLRQKHIKTHQKAKNIHRLIEEVVKDYKNVKDSEKSYLLIRKLEKAIEILFDTISPEDVTKHDEEILTEICRKINEDLHFQELREFGVQNNITFDGSFDSLKVTKHNVHNSVASSSFGTPRKANYLRPVEAKVLEETYLHFHDDFGTHISDIEQHEIHIQTLLEKDEGEELKEKEVKINSTKVTVQVITQEISPEQLLIQKQKNELSEVIARMKEEFKENRIDGAYENYLKVINYNDNNQLKGEALNFYNFNLQECQQTLNDIKCVNDECQIILKELEDEEGYSVETIKKGFAIKYKVPPGELVSIKMEGEVDIPLFNMVSLIYEMEGYTEWMPFCRTVKELKKTSKTSKAGYLKFGIPPPLSDREAYVHGAGYDRLAVNGSVFVAARSIHDKPELIEKYELDVPAQSKATRLDIQYMGASLYPISRNKIKFSIISKFDLKIKFLPVSIINWFARKAASFLIERIIKKANNLAGTMWEKKIQENREFYGWFEKKLDAFWTKQELEQGTNQQ